MSTSNLRRSISRRFRSLRTRAWDYLGERWQGRQEAARTRTSRLSVESLESREMPSITAVTPPAFEPPTTASAGSTPDSIASLKLDDGSREILVANFYGDSVSVIDPTTSSTVTTLSTGSGPNGFAVGDFGTGHQSFAIANWSSNTVSVFLGDGKGNFTSAGTLTTGTNPANEMVAADFNADGKLDLAVANQGSGNVSVFLGKGNGTFNSATNYSTASGSQAVVAGDFLGNGRMDLAVANAGTGTVSFLPNDGSGGFGTPVNVSVGSGSFYYYLASGDLDEDGKTDVVLSDFSNGNVHVLLNQGSGSFTVSDISVGSGPDGVAVGDLTGSGHLDLVVSNYFDDGVAQLLGNGDGTFQTPVNISTGSGSGPNGVVLDDFTNTGALSFATANQNSGSASSVQNTAIIGNAGQALAQPILARFSDVGGPASASAYTATINWGDSTSTSTGTVVYLGSDQYVVYGPGHVYSTAGSYSGSVSVDYTTPAGAVSIPFTATIRPTGTISGSIFNDRNASGSQDTGETGIGIWAVRLTNSTGAVVATTQTASDGTFSFENLTPGTYFVQEAVRSGWTPTTGTGQTVVVTGGGTATVTLGNYQNTIVSGKVFSDLNGNRKQQSSEPSLSGQSVQLYTKTGSTFSSSPVLTTTTDSRGNYSFSDVPPLPVGTVYVVVDVAPGQYAPQWPKSSDPNTVTLPDGRIGYELPASGGVTLATSSGTATVSGTGTLTVNTFNNSTPVTITFNDGAGGSGTLDTLLTQMNATYTDNTGLSATFNTFCIDLTHDVAPGQSASVFIDNSLGDGFANASRMQYILENYGTADLTSNPIQAAAVQLAIWDLSLSNHTPMKFR